MKKDDLPQDKDFFAGAIRKQDISGVRDILASICLSESNQQFLLCEPIDGGFTALMLAVTRGNPECVKAILQSVETKPELLKSILQAKSSRGQTALMLARSPQCMDLLLEASGLENFESFIDFVQETPASEDLLRLCNHFLQSHSKQSAAPEPEPEMESSERGTIKLDLLQLLAYQIESACAIKQLYHPLFLTSEGIDAYETGLKRCNLLCPISLLPIKQPIPLNFIGDRESLKSEDAGRELSAKIVSSIDRLSFIEKTEMQQVLQTRETDPINRTPFTVIDLNARWENSGLYLPMLQFKINRLAHTVSIEHECNFEFDAKYPKIDMIFNQITKMIPLLLSSPAFFMKATLKVARETGLLKRALEAQDIEVQDIKSCTALMGAAQNGHIESLQAMLEFAKPDKALLESMLMATSNNGLTALMWAAAFVKNECVQAILEVAKSEGFLESLLNTKSRETWVMDNDGRTALHWAVLYGHTEIARALIAAGFDLEARDAYKDTLLTLAVFHGHTEIARALIAADANLEARDGYKDTPLHWAAREGCLDITLALLAAGANLEARDNYENTPLHDAVLHEQTEAALALIAADANLEARNDAGKTPLYLAAQSGHTEIALALIDKGADLDARDEYGDTPLHWAADRDNTKIALALIKAGAHLNVQNHNGDAPLHLAAYRGNTEIALALIEKGADPNARNRNDGDTPLHLAAKRGDTEMAQALIKKGADPKAQNKNGNTPLHLAAFNGHTEVARAFLEKGADPKAQNQSGETPLHEAAQSGHTEIALALLAAGADLNAQNQSGKTPLYLAAIRGHTEVAQALIDKGAEPKTQNQSGDTPLHLATQWGNTIIAQALIDKGADLEARDECGDTPLHLAAFNGHTEIALALLAAGADPNAQNVGGYTPLHLAAFNGHTEIALALLAAGAEPNAQNKDGNTPLHLAAIYGHTEVALALLAAGAEPNAQNKDGNTPLQWAQQRNHNELIPYLENPNIFTKSWLKDNVQLTYGENGMLSIREKEASQPNEIQIQLPRLQALSPTILSILFHRHPEIFSPDYLDTHITLTSHAEQRALVPQLSNPAENNTHLLNLLRSAQPAWLERLFNTHQNRSNPQGFFSATTQTEKFTELTKAINADRTLTPLEKALCRLKLAMPIEQQPTSKEISYFKLLCDQFSNLVSDISLNILTQLTQHPQPNAPLQATLFARLSGLDCCRPPIAQPPQTQIEEIHERDLPPPEPQYP